MNKNLNKIIAGFLVFTLSWSIIISLKYYKLKNNPLILKVSNDQNLPGSQDNVQLLSIEKVIFAKQFTEQYLNFDSMNFWKNQIALTYLMDTNMQGERKEEINRLKEKIENKKMSQRGLIKNISSVQENQYIVSSEIYEQEEKINRQFNSTLKISLTTTTRTLQNPSGLLVTKIEFEQFDDKEFGQAQRLVLNHDRPMQLIFPCRVEYVEVDKNAPLSIKLTTLNFSELQILRTHELVTDIKMKANCQNKIYQITLSPTGKTSSLYQVIPESWASDRSTFSAHQVKKKTKSQYEKTIEQELGFIINE